MSNGVGNGLVSVNFNLADLRNKTDKAIASVMKIDIAPHALRESVRNAPVSPTIAQINATLKRKKRTARRVTPHGLEKSISASVEKQGNDIVGVVFVPSNSPAGKYARRIHDEKGKKWWKRGIGTQRKGTRADEKFIERAVNDNADKYQKAIERAVANAVI